MEKVKKKNVDAVEMSVFVTLLIKESDVQNVACWNLLCFRRSLEVCSFQQKTWCYICLDRLDLIWSAFWAWAFAFRSHLCVCVRERVGSLQKMFKEVNHGLFDLRQINVDYLFMCVRGIIRWNTCPLQIVPLQFTSEKRNKSSQHLKGCGLLATQHPWRPCLSKAIKRRPSVFLTDFLTASEIRRNTDKCVYKPINDRSRAAT